MYKKILCVFFLTLFLLNCRGDSINAPFDFERDTPQWLKDKIEQISDDKYYIGTTIYRYEWQDNYVYHFDIPVSSCMYCDVFNQAGIKLNFNNDEELLDFINNRKNEIVVWCWQS